MCTSVWLRKDGPRAPRVNSQQTSICAKIALQVRTNLILFAIYNITEHKIQKTLAVRWINIQETLAIHIVWRPNRYLAP